MSLPRSIGIALLLVCSTRVGAALPAPPLAIELPTGPAPQATVFDRTLWTDLELTGLFQLEGAPSALKQPHSNDCRAMMAAGVEWMLRARLTVDGAALIGQMWVLDCPFGGEVMHVDDSGWADDGSLLAHRWANQIVQAFTGQPGVFLTRLAFVHQVDGRKEIWASDVDGGHARSLTPGADLDLMPSWSKDGRQVVFTSFRNGSPMLYVVNVRTRAVTPLPAHGQLQTGPVFSPDGRQIAFTMSDHGNSDIYVMNADGSGLRRLTFDKEIDTSPTWSPDGGQIAFVSSRGGSPQLYVMNADGSNIQRLTMTGHYNQTPSWSPRGDLLAFTGRDEHGAFDVYTINIRSRQITRLTQSTGDNESPSWSPDGQLLVFGRTTKGHRQLWMMKADGSHQMPVQLDGETSSPAWGPLK